MGHSLLKWRPVAIVAAIAALVFVVACGTDDPEPAPAVDTAKLIQDAVASAQSASAAEIQKSVEAAMASQPQGASAAEIQNLVAESVTAAIAARPAGLTRADVEAIVGQSTAGQLSAADVKAIVDQAVGALPAPEIDVNQLSSLVNSAIADAVPEGVSADEISSIVQAQVSAGLAGSLTRGDVEDLVAQAVEDAVGDQLTADQVTNIVNASLVATNQAIENAAADAAQAAAAASAAQTAASAAQAAAAAVGDLPMPSGPPVQVVATTNFVADWARVVGGDRVEVFSLLQPGADPHTFLPGARDVARVADADLVLTVGLGLEAEWLEDLVHNASADESKIIALGEAVNPLAYGMVDMHDDHMDDGHDDHDDGHDDHDVMTIGRLLVADGAEAHLSVIDLSTDDVHSGVFDVAGANAAMYSTSTHRYGIVLARGPESGDDRIHIFDGGNFLVEHGDHYDLVTEPVSRHGLEIVEEWPVHSTNNHGWTAIFSDTNGHVTLVEEQGLARLGGDYEPIVLEAGIQHGTAIVISDDHVIMSVNNPACTEFIPGTWDCLPLGVEVRTFDDEVVYDAANAACTNLHGDAHNEHGVVFGCQEGVLFVHEHDGHYEHEILPYPPELGEPGASAIITYYGHHHSENFFGIGNQRCCGQAGVWLVDVVNRELREVFPDPSAAFAFSSDGETFYILADDGVLRAFDSHDGELVETLQLIDPFERVFGTPSPSIIVVGEWLYAADPNGGHVLGVHLEHMEIEEEWEVGGAPSNLTFVGVTGSGDDHHEEGHDDHDDGHDDHEEGHDDHGAMAVGRLLVADAVEAHLSIVDLSTDGVESGIFDVAAPRSTVYPSPTHRFAIVLSRGPEDADDRVHVFDGGIFLVEHDDHHDLVQGPMSRHSLEIADERPIHYVNSHGWTAIFADAHGHAFLINEEELAASMGDYEPVVLEAGPQHGAALVISDEHVFVTTKNPDYPENSDSSLPVGVEVRDFNDRVVYDASNRSCPGMHGESHNEHGAAFGCVGGVLFLHAHDGTYEHDFIANPPEMREDSRIGSVYGHHHVEHFFGRASYRTDEGFVDDGIWLIDVDHGEMHQVFSEPSLSTKFSSDGELLYVLGADGVLHALDAHDGDLVATLDLVEPGEAGRAAMIVVGEWLYVADPNSGHVLGVHLEHMEIEEEWHIGGAPSSLAFIGVTDAGGAPEAGHDDHGHEGHDHDHGTHDPHFWFDPLRVKVAVNEIAAQLSAIDPGSASVYYQNAAEYGKELDELHAWIEEQVSAVAPERRLLVTSHDAFTYLALAYGFEIVGLVIPSLATHVEPSAEHLAGLVEVVRERGVPALFGETTVSERLAQAVARETGAKLFRLYSGSLGPEGSGADTYLGMVRANIETIVEALR